MKHAVEAGKQALAASHYHPADVTMLINCGVYRDGHICEPANAVYIQNGLGINVEFQGRRTLSFDLLNGSCGMLNGAHLLCSLMRAGELRLGMVVSSEANSDRSPDPAYRYPASGAALVIDISPLSEVGFGAFAFQTHHQHSDLYRAEVSLQRKRGKLRLSRAQELESVYLSLVQGLLDELLQKEELRREQIDYLVAPQLSREFIAALPEAAGVARERVVDLTDELSDTHSTGLVLALAGALKQRTPLRGERALLLGFGAGVTIGGAIYHF